MRWRPNPVDWAFVLLLVLIALGLGLRSYPPDWLSPSWFF